MYRIVIKREKMSFAIRDRKNAAQDKHDNMNNYSFHSMSIYVNTGSPF